MDTQVISHTQMTKNKNHSREDANSKEQDLLWNG